MSAPSIQPFVVMLEPILLRLTPPLREEDVSNGWDESTARRYRDDLTSLCRRMRADQRLPTLAEWNVNIGYQLDYSGVSSGTLHRELVHFGYELGKAQRLVDTYVRLSSPLSEKDVGDGWDEARAALFRDRLKGVYEGLLVQGRIPERGDLAVSMRGELKRAGLLIEPPNRAHRGSLSKWLLAVGYSLEARRRPSPKLRLKMALLNLHPVLGPLLREAARKNRRDNSSSEE